MQLLYSEFFILLSSDPDLGSRATSSSLEDRYWGLIIERILVCPKSDFPIKYLELPLQPNALRRKDWLVLIKKF